MTSYSSDICVPVYHSQTLRHTHTHRPKPACGTTERSTAARYKHAQKDSAATCSTLLIETHLVRISDELAAIPVKRGFTQSRQVNSVTVPSRPPLTQYS
jgi:hypothetical protein